MFMRITSYFLFLFPLIFLSLNYNKYKFIIRGNQYLIFACFQSHEFEVVV